jgi:hypothetical protein
MEIFSIAGIAQLGERHTEYLKVAFSIHAHRNLLFSQYFETALFHANSSTFLSTGEQKRLLTFNPPSSSSSLSLFFFFILWLKFYLILFNRVHDDMTFAFHQWFNVLI